MSDGIEAGKKLCTTVSTSIFALVVLALALTPYMPWKDSMSFFFYLLLWTTMAVGLNIMMGFTGYVNFGYVVFFGTGAMAGGLAIEKLGISPYLAPFVGGLAAAALAALVGIPTLRGLRGAYFAIATLGVLEAVKILLMDLLPFGVTIPPSYYEPNLCYFYMLATAVGTFALSYLVLRSRLRFAFVAIREDEDAAQARGINTFKYKMIANLLSAVPAGFLGAIEIWHSTYATPQDVFLAEKTIAVIAMVLLGGIGTLMGPIIGAVCLYGLENALWVTFPFAHLIAYGVIIIGIVLFAREGLLGLFRSGIRFFSQSAQPLQSIQDTDS
jgi:branched-chain amino acid transport system permease protein